MLQRYAELMMSAPDELAATAGVSFKPDGEPVVFLTPAWSGQQTHGRKIIAQFERLGTPILSKVELTSYGPCFVLQMLFSPARYSAVQTRWQPAVATTFISDIIEAGNNSPSPLSVITVQSFHGAPTRVPLESTACGLRKRHFLVLILAAWEQVAQDNVRHASGSEISLKHWLWNRCLVAMRLYFPPMHMIRFFPHMRAMAHVART